jgi:multimeric flavodoxin WrbA
MKAVALCGSPRVEGNTERLLTKALAVLAAGGAETQLIRLAGKTIRTCTGCGGCRTRQDGTCVIGDDDFQPVFNAMRQADIIIVGSPVYFGSATGEITALLDRAGYVSRANGNLLSRKLGGPVVVARRAGQNFTFAQLLLWYMINDMVVPGSSYWNIGFGREPGEVENDHEAISTITRFAENLLWLANKTVCPA